MPNKTFLNLSKEKQKNIIDISIKEFSTYDFETASINRIITELGIAKGSFYRYFNNKEDLYLYVVDYAINIRFDYIIKGIDIDSCDLIEGFRKICYRCLEFDLKNPDYNNLLYRAIETGINLKTQFHKSNIGCDYFDKLVKDAQNKGKINRELNSDLLVYLLLIINYNLERFISRKLGITYDQIAKNGFDQYKKLISEIIDQVTAFISNGVSI